MKNKGLIWLASYPRSGNTWLRHFLGGLIAFLRGAPDDQIGLSSIERSSTWECALRHFEPFVPNPGAPENFNAVVAARPKAQQAMCDRAPGLLLVKTHLVYAKVNGTPLINDAVTRAAVYLVRDPRDVACSFAAHKGVSIDVVIEQMENEQCFLPNGVGEVISSWSRNVESWTNPPRPSVLVARYEDLVENPLLAFSSIASHIGIVASPDQIAHAIELSSFERLQREERMLGRNPWSGDGKGGFFRRGRAGGWRDELPPEKARRIEAAHRATMVRFGYLSG